MPICFVNKHQINIQLRLLFFFRPPAPEPFCIWIYAIVKQRSKHICICAFASSFVLPPPSPLFLKRPSVETAFLDMQWLMRFSSIVSNKPCSRTGIYPRLLLLEWSHFFGLSLRIQSKILQWSRGFVLSLRVQSKIQGSTELIAIQMELYWVHKWKSIHKQMYWKMHVANDAQSGCALVFYDNEFVSSFCRDRQI